MIIQDILKKYEDHLHVEVKKAIDEGRLSVTNAMILGKLSKYQQPIFLNNACRLNEQTLKREILENLFRDINHP